MDTGQRGKLNDNLGFRYRTYVVVIARNEKPREAEVTVDSRFINAPNILITVY